MKPRTPGMRIPGDESAAVPLGALLRGVGSAAMSALRSRGAVTILRIILWLLLAGLVQKLMTRGVGLLTGGAFILCYMGFAATRLFHHARTDADAVVLRSAKLGTGAAAIGFLLWMLAARTGEYTIFFLLVAPVPLAFVFAIFVASGTLVARFIPRPGRS